MGIDINSPEVVKAIDELVQKKLDSYYKTKDKRYVGTVTAVSRCKVTINLPNETKDIVIQNPNEIPVEINDQVSIMAYGNNLGNAVVENRFGLTLNNIYVDGSLGVDSYGYTSSGIQYGTSQAPFKTIQYAVNRLPKNLNNIDTYINCYNVNNIEDIVIKGFYGGGLLQIYNDSVCQIVRSVSIYGCSAPIAMYYISPTQQFTIKSSTCVVIGNAVVDGVTPYGVFADYNASVLVSQSTFSNKTVAAICAYRLSNICSLDNVGGSNNNRSLYADYASMIGKSGGQPMSTNGELYLNGSIIR